MTWEKKKILVIVKAYPEMSKKHNLVVCTAGLTDYGEWIRLYPVEISNFLGDNRVHKFDWIEAEVKKATGEKLGRKESYKVRPGSIRIIDSSFRTKATKWELRNSVLSDKISNSIEELDQMYQLDKTSLGLIKPKDVFDFYHTEDLEILDERLSFQKTLLGGKIPLMADIPHIFKYRFICQGCPDGKEHNIQCEDWELLESYRKWGISYGRTSVLWEKLYLKYFTELYLKRELFFFMGMFSLFPSWLIIGLYYPPKPSKQKAANLTLDIFSNKD